MSSIDKESDDFWDLGKLVPPKKPAMTPFASSGVSTVEHNVKGEPEKKSEERKLNFKDQELVSRNEEYSFVPNNMSLIKRITVKRTLDKYDFYGNFRKAALIYHEYKMTKCDFTPFYSYMPQYTQMTPEQKNYYFYWRDELRHGKFIRTDYSYLYLYVYEILNLPDKIKPDEGIKLLCRLWRHYRETLPKIDQHFSVWVQDYCFVHNLACPIDEVRDYIFDVIATSDFKEFYLSDLDGAGDYGIEAMIAYLSDYDWRKGKVTTEDNAELYRKHINGAMKRVFKVLCIGVDSEEDTNKKVLERYAFPSSLCTHAVKCRLTIEYVSLSADDELKKEVTASLRYTENKLRALFGVKSRLGVKDLPDNCRKTIDNYFDNVFEMERTRREKDLAPEYEKLYNAEKKELSFEDADEIERSSWTTTVRLVDTDDADDDEGAEIGTSSESNTSDSPATDMEQTVEVSERNGAESYGLTIDDIKLIKAALDGRGEAIDDDAFERINEAFSENFGDIILEHDGEKYVIIEDYVDDVENWLSNF